MQSSDENCDIFCSVFSELKSLGVKVPKIKKFKSCIPKQVRSVSSVPLTNNKIFGVSITEQEKISSKDYLLPKFIVISTSYLRKFSQKEIGLFRKAGSVSRQRDLRIKLERGESIDNSEPNDVASLLKQWLRELPEPLIPSYLQDLFLRCHNLQIEGNRVSAVLLCCHLLPVEHFYTLKYLLDFLSEISKFSDKNKMGARNLALIMAPNIFVMGATTIGKSSNNLVQQHTSVIELLITNAHKVGAMPQCSSSHLAEAEALKSDFDLDLSTDTLDYSPSKSKKKRKSGGPVQDLFTGIRKLVSQRSVSPNPKRLDQDDYSSDTRCAKRKADPEHLTSMSPLKKQATASKVLHNETADFTPKNKTTQSIFGTKEKSGSARSRGKSFGLLRRKEKKRKSSKTNVLLDTKLSVTPDPFQEKLVESLQKSAEVGDSFCMSSPLLSPLDIEKIWAYSGFTKKSVSDCYLTVQKESGQNKKLFSSSSSEGCLHLESSSTPAYNLRSTNNGRRPLKRKSNELSQRVPFVFPVRSTEVEKENFGLIDSLWFDKNSKNSPVASRKSPKALSSVNVNSSSTTSVLCNRNNRIVKTSDQTDSLKVPNIPVRRNHSREQSVSDVNLTRSDINDVSGSTPSITLKQSDVVHSTVTDIEIEEKVKRNCSIKRQEAFVVKSKSRKNTLNQLKRADSIKLSRSKNNRVNHQNDILNVSSKTSQKLNCGSVCEALACVKENDNTVSAKISDNKRTKRSVRKGSIVRGRPNTVKTGLPSGVHNRYNSESAVDCEQLTSSDIVNDLQTNAENHSETNNNDMSITLQIKNMTLSPKDISTEGVESKSETLKCTLETTVSVDVTKTKIVTVTTEANVVTGETKENIVTDVEVNTIMDAKEPKIVENRVLRNVSKRKLRERLCSNSDSKIHMKKKSSKVSRINSFPQSSAKSRTRKAQKLRSVKSAIPKKSFKEEVSNLGDTEKENLLIKKSQNQLNINTVKTPETNADSPDTWVSGRKFFEAQAEAAQDDTSNKRESIAMILRNNHGHVRAKASFYDVRSRSSSSSTPMTLRSATPGGVFYNPQSCDMYSRHSQKKSASIKSTKSRRRNSPLPPPPKFVIPDSPVSSYPLKELTNLSNTEDSLFSPSPSKVSFSTPKKEENSSKKKSTKSMLKPKMNSFSGHTPYRLPVDRSKVFRSESSPMLPKVANKPSRSSREYLDQISAVTNHNESSIYEDCFSSPVIKTKSSLSIERLRSDQLLDEWNCEM